MILLFHSFCPKLHPAYDKQEAMEAGCLAGPTEAITASAGEQGIPTYWHRSIFSSPTLVSLGQLASLGLGLGTLIPRIRGVDQSFLNAIYRFMIGVNIFVISMGLAPIGFGNTVLLLSVAFVLMIIQVWGFPFLETRNISLEQVSGHCRTSPPRDYIAWIKFGEIQWRRKSLRGSLGEKLRSFLD